MNLKSLYQPFSVFIFFIVVSQCILPSLKIDNFPPFFIWSLFSKNPTNWTFYDLQIANTKTLSFYTDLKLGDAELWQTIQDVGHSLHSDKKDHYLLSLKIQLQKRKIPGLKIVKINTPLTVYVNSNPSKKENYVEDAFLL